MTAINNKPNPNQVIFVHSAVESNEGSQLRKRLWTLVAIFIVCVIGGFLLGTTIALKLKHSNNGKAVNESINPIVLNCSTDPLSFVNRTEWLAQPPDKPLDKLRHPVSKAIIAHTVTDPCSTLATCKRNVLEIQGFHIQQKNFTDIAYNFLIGGDGRVYIGRGWGVAGAHTKGYNHESMAIAFIGTYEVVEPSQQQLCAAKKLLAQGHALGKLTNDYGLYGHCQLTDTISPGVLLYKIIQTWEHWREDVAF